MKRKLLIGCLILILFMNNIYAETLFEDYDRYTATDGLGRVLPGYTEAGPKRDNKYVGIFFHTWHDWDATRGTRNITEILKQHPDIVNDYNSPYWGNSPVYHWKEPVFNYYKTSDEWVLRKQAELLADAGVDVIIFDNTNGTMTFMESVEKLMKVFEQARKDGVKTPQISFMLPTFNYDDVAVQLRELYDVIYFRGRYEDLWFYWKGKPLILGYPGHLDLSDPVDKEISQFFSYRPTNHSHTWDNVQVRDENGNPTVYGDIGKEVKDNYIVWNWISIYPQLIAKNPDGTPEQVSVSVAQNWSKKRALTAMNGENVYGRHYSVKQEKYDDRENAKLYGINFEEQFEYALDIDPEFIFITGWNEWVAGRYDDFLGVKNAFPDQFSDEYSRDIEPSLGDLKDHYYYQMVKYIRLFKGVNKPFEVSEPKTIDIYSDQDQWSDVYPEYFAYPGNTVHRNSRGYLNNETDKYYQYTSKTGRNDISRAKVARDKDNIYFMVECVEDISPPADSRWMRLLLDIKGSENNNWESFNYIINRESPGDKAVLERSTGGWNWEKVGDVEYSVRGNRLQLKVTKSMLGITEDEMTINFKWSDNMQNEGDAMDLYVNGDAAPGGRFKFCYTTLKYEDMQKPSYHLYILFAIFSVISAGLIYVYIKKRTTGGNKMKGKKVFFISVLCILLVLVISACKGSEEAAPTPTEKPPSTPTATPMQTATPVPTPSPEPTPIVTIEPGTEKYAEGIKSESPSKAYLDKEDPAIIAGLHIDPSSSVSIQFFPTTTFDKIHVRLCTWTQTTGHSIEVQLYKWQGSYDATLMSEPVFSNTYTDYPDNIWLEVDLGQTFVDGEYLVDIANASGAGHVGVWISKEEHVMQRFYKNAEVYEEGIAQFAVGYTKTPNKIYGPLSDPGF